MVSEGNHDKFARFVLLAVSEAKAVFPLFFVVVAQCFGIVCDIQNNQGPGKGYQPHPSASADNPYLDLDYSEYLKNHIQ